MSGIETSYIINHDTLVHNLFSNTTHDSHFLIFESVQGTQKSLLAPNIPMRQEQLDYY